ncbi:MAG: hypothetical protein CMQ34_08305 [Gammaproteobacteria bacterium]|nr:hypothetical protein [Gammaproteobacteria bacterium]|tara:strand:- start:2152 stop:2973 length:822 start_codon:yes stop_codon:yes gene_type:complete
MNVLLERDTPLVVKGEKAYINRVNVDGEQLSITTDKGVERLLSFAELMQLYSSGEVIFGPGAETNRSPKKKRDNCVVKVFLSENEQKDVQYRLGYIRAISQQDLTSLKPEEERTTETISHAESINDENPPSFTTIFRWLRRLRAGKGQLHALIPKHKKKGNRTPRLKKKVEDHMEEAIHKYFLSRPSKKMKHVYEWYLEVAIDDDPTLKEDDFPTYKTFCRRIHKIANYTKFMSQEGFLSAQNNYPSGSPVRQAKFSLAAAEADHTPICSCPC